MKFKSDLNKEDNNWVIIIVGIKMYINIKCNYLKSVNMDEEEKLSLK